MAKRATVKQEVKDLREVITIMQEAQSLPRRFVAERVEGEPCVKVMDMDTLKSATFGLCDMPGVIAALKAFG